MGDINNTNQVSYMAESCQILSDTLNMIESHIKPGQSVIELDRLAEVYILSRDAKSAFKGFKTYFSKDFHVFIPPRGDPAKITR